MKRQPTGQSRLVIDATSVDTTKLICEVASKRRPRASPEGRNPLEACVNTFTLLGPKWLDDHITWSFAIQTFNEDTSTPFAGAIPVVWQDFIEQAFSRWAAVSG